MFLLLQLQWRPWLLIWLFWHKHQSSWRRHILVELAIAYVLAQAVFNTCCSDGGGVIVIDLDGDIQSSILYYFASSSD